VTNRCIGGEFKSIPLLSAISDLTGNIPIMHKCRKLSGMLACSCTVILIVHRSLWSEPDR